MNRYDVVVIGGVAAGTKVAAKTRRERQDWSIAVLTDDEHISYAGCGLPYYIGDVITTQRQLLVNTPEELSASRNLDIFTGHKVVEIKPQDKVVEVELIENGEMKQFGYRKLVLATGARAFLPPLPGIELDGVYTLRNVPDAVRIKKRIVSDEVKKVTIVGAGYIGMETAENLKEQGVDVTVIEMLPRIIPLFDPEISIFIENHAAEMGLNIMTSTCVKAFEGEDGWVTRVMTDKGVVEADAVLVSIGVRPNTDLCDDIGIKCGTGGAICVQPDGTTNIDEIFAAGDCATTKHCISGDEVWVPMGSTANKQGRATAMTLSGETDHFPGVLGTSIVKIFDMGVGKTGMSEEEANKAGYDVVSVLVPADDRAHYYPGAEKIFIKLVADAESRGILGGQIFGEGCVDKPLDALVASITLKAKADDLAKMDFAYSPPYSSAINPLNLAATVLSNKLKGKLQSINPWELHGKMKGPNWNGVILDVREIPEYMISTIPGSLNISMTDFEGRLLELEALKDKEVVILCNVGRRAYESFLRLKHMGFGNLSVLEGGMKAWPFESE